VFVAYFASLVYFFAAFISAFEEHFSNVRRFSELSEIINLQSACQLLFSAFSSGCVQPKDLRIGSTIIHSAQNIKTS